MPGQVLALVLGQVLQSVLSLGPVLVLDRVLAWVLGLYLALEQDPDLG